jgi:ATP-binding cassette, subfamily B, bacterial
MNYTLKTYDGKNTKRENSFKLLKRFSVYLNGEKLRLGLATLSIIINSAANVATPLVLGYTIDQYITHKDLAGITHFSLILAVLYIIISLTSFIQTRAMGIVGQNILFKLRNALFLKIQSLPLAFFNQNKLGDLISRINNDTDKLNQFFTQSLNQFVGNIFVIIGIGVFIFFVNPKLALITVSSALVLFVITYFLSPWIHKQNRLSLQTLGNLSAEIQESLNNFKVIVSFDRRDYFRNNFNKVNSDNFSASFKSGVANNLTAPIYDLFGNIASLLVLGFGITMILQGQLTIGILVSFLNYSDKFYSPLRQMAAIWSNAQSSLAAWNRILEILNLNSDLPVLPHQKTEATKHIMQFQHVSFGYNQKKVLHNVNFTFDKGKTYAIVGPTGGGKSTTASLMSRLYDPQKGEVFFEGRDIRTFEPAELSQKIGFILQDQFLFTGTVGENIAYGNQDFAEYSKENLENLIEDLDLCALVAKFEDGLNTPVTPTTELISLGQKQLISFIRAIIRKPELLIMDEATANIDTITEGLLQQIIDKLPQGTTKVIIAHRFNTIKNADEIYFVNNGQVVSAESYEKSLQMIKESKRTS